MPYPFVKSATIQNSVITLTVELDYADSGSYVEISGSATQSGGAYANFYAIAEAPSGFAGPTGPHPTVDVSAHSEPPNNFTIGEDVTTVVRLSKLWVTVLGPNASQSSNTSGGQAAEGTTWDTIKRLSHVTGGFSDDSQGDGPQSAPPASQ
jgi:hypothetical protein